MELSEAIDLIKFKPVESARVWIDLGCGSGLFTLALANYLPPDSVIYAIDKNEKILKTITDSYKTTQIRTIAADFIRDPLPVMKADGILMANSLHYVQDKTTFIQKLIAALNPGGSSLLVDYDMNRPNQWVPYPLQIANAIKLFNDAGFSSFEILNKRRSVYGDHDMYAALISS